METWKAKQDVWIDLSLYNHPEVVKNRAVRMTFICKTQFKREKKKENIKFLEVKTVNGNQRKMRRGRENLILTECTVGWSIAPMKKPERCVLDCKQQDTRIRLETSKNFSFC